MLRRRTLWTRCLLGLTLAASALVAGVIPKPAHAAQTLRYTTDEHGDMTVFGNTLGHDCSTTAVVPNGTYGVLGPRGEYVVFLDAGNAWNTEDQFCKTTPAPLTP